MEKQKNVTIKVSSTTYQKILAIQKKNKPTPSIKAIVDFAISKLR